MANEGVLCQVCGIEAPSRHVEFHQNIGVLVMRFHRQVRGRVCKSCLHKKYWQMTGTTLAVGWLGFVSIIIAPIFIINNTVRYLAALGMAPVPPGARIPVLDQAAIAKLQPLASELVRRLNDREELLTVSRDVAARAGVSPGQVIKYVVAISKQPPPPRAPESPVAPVVASAAQEPKNSDGPIPVQPMPAESSGAKDGPDPLLPI